MKLEVLSILLALGGTCLAYKCSNIPLTILCVIITCLLILDTILEVRRGGSESKN